MREAGLLDVWVGGGSFFDASVDPIVLVFERGARTDRVRRWSGASFEPAAPVELGPNDAKWSRLISNAPDVAEVSGPVLGDVASVTADFRDQYYGLVGHVHDHGAGVPLITAGLIDIGAHQWGNRSTRFGSQPFIAPMVDITALGPELSAWAGRRLVPKVLVATQTKVLEACADPDGSLLPSVPVISVVPTDSTRVNDLTAIICSPFASAWAWGESAGAGLSANALKVSARQLARLPLPAGPVADAYTMLTAQRLEDFAHMMCDAYAVDREPLCSWWLSRTIPTRSSALRTGRPD